MIIVVVAPLVGKANEFLLLSFKLVVSREEEDLREGANQ